MIKNWTLGNFKSIRETQTLEFRPLTILTGQNSAGKSALIQSILAITQTLRNPSPSGPPLHLNGHLVKLGNMDEIRHSHPGVSSKEITLGFQIVFPQARDRLSISQRGGFPLSASVLSGFDVTRRGRTGSPEYRRIRVKVESERRALRPGQTPLFSVERYETFFEASILKRKRGNRDQIYFEGERPDDLKKLNDPQSDEEAGRFGPVDFNLNESSDRKTQRKVGLRATFVRNQYMRDFLRTLDLDGSDISRNKYEIIIGLLIDHRLDVLVNTPKQWLVGMETERFLPETVYYCVKQKEVEFSRIFISLLEATEDTRPNNLLSQLTPSELSGAKRMLAHILQQYYEQTVHPGTTVDVAVLEDWREGDFNQSFPIFKNIIDGSSKGVHQNGFDWSSAVKELKKTYLRDQEQVFILSNREQNEQTQSATRRIKDFFEDHVDYLGPLRADPSPVYPHSTDEKSGVGLKGEFTSFVFDANQNEPLRYYPPESGDEVSGNFLKAVNDWLEYLELPHIKPKEVGKLGFSVSIDDPAIQGDLDLTNVGVGVSQILPVLVMGLSSNAGATLIFEQPEIHLHPRLQASIAEFFIALTKSGRQCIIETHSEHIINRIRRRVSEDQKTTLADDTLIYFAQKDDGQTRFDRIEINEYGALADWPVGFFDQAQLESQEIISSAIAKRKAQQS